MNDILTNIKLIRAELGLSQEFVADKLNMEQASYGLIENGKRKLKFDQLEQIAIVFSLRTIDLITWPKKFLDPELCEQNNKIKASILFELDEMQKDKMLITLFGVNYQELLNKK